MSQLLPNLNMVHSGKVREMYEIPGHKHLLLMLATDRISTHNVVHLSHIPRKGEVLTALTIFWDMKLKTAGIATHVVAYGQDILDYVEIPVDMLARCIVVIKAEPVHHELIFRNYLTGSLYHKEYKAGRDPYLLDLEPGLPLMHHFDEPIFTPTRKSVNDEPMDWRHVYRSNPKACDLAKDAFAVIQQHLAYRGITLIDGKFEASSEMLVDEFGTGDCCRMAYTSDMKEGVEPPFLDKEPIRICAKQMWGGGAEVPLEFPPEVIELTSNRYLEVFRAITRSKLELFQRGYMYNT